MSPKDVAEIINKGGTILGTTRTNPFKSDGGVEKVLETFKKLKLDALVVLGGEDTLGVAFETISLEAFVRIFEERFEVLRQDRVANSERVLLHMRRRA